MTNVRRALVVCLLLASLPALAQSPRFQVSFPASAHAQPITGRVFIIIARNDRSEPRLQAGGWYEQIPIYGVDVAALQPGQPAIIDANTLAYPFQSLKQLPAGEYYVQALINIYTEFHRSDGHLIWAHMDQWEGQQFNKPPANLYSDVQKVPLDPAAGYDIKLETSKVTPPVKVPADTQYVKHVKFESKVVSAFWGRPMYIGATILLPKGYDDHPNERYPVIYIQDHFSLRAPFGFRDEENDEDGWPGRNEARQFTRAWLSNSF